MGVYEELGQGLDLRHHTDGRAYYHCRGSGPLRKGCGARLVPANVLDAIVLKRMSANPFPHRERVFTPGRNTAEELRDLNRQIAEAAARGDYGLVAVLSEKATAASESEDVRGRWELRDTGLTIGEHFRSLDRRLSAPSSLSHHPHRAGC